jgi:hypothetical protein
MSVWTATRPGAGSYRARFAAVLMPSETLKANIWKEEGKEDRRRLYVSRVGKQPSWLCADDASSSGGASRHGGIAIVETPHPDHLR